MLAGSYIWYDEVDAVSFPGINVLKGESQDIFDKTNNIVMALAEGGWDLIPESLRHTNFNITIHGRFSE